MLLENIYSSSVNLNYRHDNHNIFIVQATGVNIIKVLGVNLLTLFCNVDNLTTLRHLLFTLVL
jgi:hypothetical protein